MTIKTAATFFAGAGGACTGLEQAGYQVLWANEYHPEIGDIWQANHKGYLNRGDILNVPPSDVPKVDLHWYSPPCPEYSGAKPGRKGGTATEDTSLAQKMVDIAVANSPRWVAIENVPAYRHSHSYKLITDRLNKAGYRGRGADFNAAALGVAQARKRFLAWFDLKRMPAPIAQRNYPPTKRRGWYEVLQDLIPDLVPCTLTPNQKAAISCKRANQLSLFAENQWLLLQRTGYGSAGPQAKSGDQQCWTITASHGSESLARPSTPRNPGTIHHLPTGRSWHVDTQCIARLQGFPDSYNWLDKPGIARRAIGNAVAVPVAEMIGRTFTNKP